MRRDRVYSCTANIQVVCYFVDTNPEQARKWVEENITHNSKTEINGVSFEIFANSKNLRTLVLTPSK